MPFYQNPDNSLRAFLPDEIAAMGIETYKIESGEHPTHSRQPSASTIRATYLVNYEQYEYFVSFMLGGSWYYEDAGGTTRLTRLMPQTWPGRAQYACSSIDGTEGHQFVADDNVSAQFPVPTYSQMKVDVTFQQVPFGLKTDAEIVLAGYDETQRYLQTLPSEPSTDYITLPGGCLRFIAPSGSGPTGGQPIPINHNIGFPVTGAIIKRKWWRIPFNQWGPGSRLYQLFFPSEEGSATQSIVGTINSQPVIGYNPGQLLLLAPEEEIQSDTAGTPLGADTLCWNLTFKWLLKPQGHNWFWYQPAAPNTGAPPAGAGFYFVTNNNTWYPSSTLPDGVSLFNARDHNVCFQISGTL